MQRHFSNRGEALSEVTAARMLARRKPAESRSAAPNSRQFGSGQWFTKTEVIRVPKTHPKKHDRNFSPIL